MFQLLTRNFFFGGGDLRSKMMRSLKEDKLWIEQMTVCQNVNECGDASAPLGMTDSIKFKWRDRAAFAGID